MSGRVGATGHCNCASPSRLTTSFTRDRLITVAFASTQIAASPSTWSGLRHAATYLRATCRQPGLGWYSIVNTARQCLTLPPRRYPFAVTEAQYNAVMEVVGGCLTSGPDRSTPPEMMPHLTLAVSFLGELGVAIADAKGEGREDLG
jgi:hypothetical protein